MARVGWSLTVLLLLACGGTPEDPRPAPPLPAEAEPRAAVPSDRDEHEIEVGSYDSLPAAVEDEALLPVLPPLTAQELRDKLESGYAADRAAAVAQLEPVGTGLFSLLEVLKSDPEPLVRVAAADRLVESDAYSAALGLTLALDDEDPRVVLVAIDSLEERGDPSLIESLVPLEDHRDAEVRRSAARAIRNLE